MVKDLSNPYMSQPLSRVKQLCPPTQWELEQHNHGIPPTTTTFRG
jgi:hypothetical protein